MSSILMSKMRWVIFSLPFPVAAHAEARREWADLAAVAGTGEAVAFASYAYFGGFVPDPARAAAEVYVLMPASEYPGVSRELREQMGNRIGLGHGGTLRVWPEAMSVATPKRYSTAGVGVVRLGKGNHDDVVAELRARLAR